MKWIPLFLIVPMLVISACSEVDDSYTSCTPESVGCNTVSCGECSFQNIGCEPGIASFDVDISTGSCSGHFAVECSGGCVSSVSGYASPN